MYIDNLINFKSFLLISILFCLEFIDSKKRGEGDILTHLSEIIRGPFSIPLYHLYHLIGRGALAGEIRPRRIATVLLPSQSCRSTLIQPSKPVTLPPSQLEKCWRIFSVCDWWSYCKALCDEKFSQIEGYGRQFRHIELCKSISN